MRGAEAVLNTADHATSEDAAVSEAIIVGTCLEMSSADERMKCWIDPSCSSLRGNDTRGSNVGGVCTTGSGFENAGGG